MSRPPPRTGGFGPGFFGKAPALGDFVRVNLPAEAVAPLDQQLSDAMDLGRRRHGAGWAARFAAAPGWRFAFPLPRGKGVLAAGVVAPSRDRVGRVYPLAVLAALPAGTGAVVAPFACDGWYAAAEDALLAAIAGALAPEGLGRALADLGPPLPDPAFPEALCRRLLTEYAGSAPDGAGLWWTLGAAEGDAHLAAWPGLPPVDRLTALFDGGWRNWSNITP